MAFALPVDSYLQTLHDRHKANRTGKLADYIPELTRIAPDLFGLAFVTMDGHIYEAGDTKARFTIQSISKPLIYGMALEEHGREAVLKRIGVEPSGEAFNSIAFDERNNRPFNPMVNAGAIAATALVKGADHAERFARILETFERFVGRRLEIDEDVYRSESLTGHRNRAIAYLELNFGMIDGDVDAHLDLYFRQCSLLVDTVDLALIGATLANGGVNPVTGERALSSDNVRAVLSVMNTCGMYDYAGGWQFDVGLPAKSGVGGGIAAVLPGHLGIGTFSPRLDAVGNSERGVKVCEDISRSFRLHLFEDRGQRQSPIRRIYRGTDIRSSRVRRRAEIDALDHYGHAIGVVELQGDVHFMEAEAITRRIRTDLGSLACIILDMSRVRRVDGVAEALLASFAAAFAGSATELAVVSGSPRLRELGGANGFPAVDEALEHFEDVLLARVIPQEQAAPEQVPIESFALLAEWPDDLRARLAGILCPRAVKAGEVLIAAGSQATALFFLTSGRVTVSIAVDGGKRRRISTIDPGNVFGELALFGSARRTADVIAQTDGEVLLLSGATLADIEASDPRLHLALALAVGRSLADRLARANREIQVLAR
ncbi:L-glutaminase [Devosia enhydra]|uniref:Glutaminase n=1 Tax=Devosia enhydra TaxID=665118 RepID=A0A1K2HZ38_9HYPH|nr:glutaminase A [Devosia enhydra]SFZ85312.1 L-glutaminase [Devosia enhydra]